VRTRRWLLTFVLGLACVFLTPAPAAGDPNPAPAIHSFSPPSGPVGTAVVISGTHFTGATSVTVNLTAASFTVDSNAHISAIVPSGATTGPIRVTTPDGTAASSSSFVVTPLGAPTITSFSPTSGPVGGSVEISGTNLTGATSVTFNLVSATFTVNSATHITAVVPAGATTGPIRVTTPLGTATSATSFTVTTGGTGGVGGRPLSATLSGAAEVPGPGDPDGGGSALIRINPGLRKVCFDLAVAGIGLPATAAHIHEGRAGVAGPVVVTLSPPGAGGTSSGCVRGLDRRLLVGIIQRPARYYVNVHTTESPGGAVRGQLSKGFPAGATLLSTRLSGASEVPGPGDPDGTGSAAVTLDPALGKICFTIAASGITLPAAAAHIHQGAVGVAGPIVVTLVAPGVTGSSSGCLSGVGALAGAIAANPAGYYVNVHTIDFPAGAIRGQL